MILIASSKENFIAQKLNEEAGSFFKLQFFSKVQQFLESYLEAKNIKYAIPTVVANLSHQGSLLWVKLVYQSGLSGSVISTKDTIFCGSLHQGILLDFSMKHEIIKKLANKVNKVTRDIPNITNLMFEQLEAIYAFASLFFTEKSYLLKSFQYLHLKIIKY